MADEKTKLQLIQELNTFLLIDSLHWELLPEADLLKLTEAFRKLRADLEDVFQLLDEAPTIIPDKGLWREYTR